MLAGYSVYRYRRSVRVPLLYYRFLLVLATRGHLLLLLPVAFAQHSTDYLVYRNRKRLAAVHSDRFSVPAPLLAREVVERANSLRRRTTPSDPLGKARAATDLHTAAH